MIDILYSIDLWLFRAGNQALANPVFDVLLPILTNERYMLGPYVLILVLLLWKGGRNGRIAVLLAVITVVLADRFNDGIVKEMVGRIRPCHVLEDVRLLINCGAGKSFPSNHAVNNGVAAVIFGFFYRRAALSIALYAALIAYSRVYCGVHYPFDVIAGMAEGATIGFLVLAGWHIAFARVPKLALPASPLELFRRDKSSAAVQP